jgi:hypothetical protein
MSRFSKVLGLTGGIAATAILLLFGVLMIDWARSTSSVERDDLVAQARSPDERFVAEIHLFTTAMHGGPDKLYVTLGRAGLSSSDKIYERTYECDDRSAFRLQWASTHELIITYGECDAEHERSKGPYSDFYYKEQNRVWQCDSTWQDVKINYQDSRYIAAY